MDISPNGFTTLVTTDKHLATEQRHPYIAIVAVDDNRLTALRGALTEIAQAIRSTAPGEHRIVNTLRLMLRSSLGARNVKFIRAPRRNRRPCPDWAIQARTSGVFRLLTRQST